MFGMETQPGGGVMDSPLVGGVGYADWATMSGMSPASPLVGGQAGQPGYGAGQRQVAVGEAPVTLASASGSPAAANWRELFNLKGNPIGWVCLAAIAYLGLTHLSIRQNLSIGKGGRR
jgi:hypothetical protein